MTNENDSQRVRPDEISSSPHGGDCKRCHANPAKSEEMRADPDAMEDQTEDGGIDEEAVEVALGEEETRKPRIARRPLAPTKEMVEEHNRTHADSGIAELGSRQARTIDRETHQRRNWV